MGIQGPMGKQGTENFLELGHKHGKRVRESQLANGEGRTGIN